MQGPDEAIGSCRERSRRFYREELSSEGKSSAAEFGGNSQEIRTGRQVLSYEASS